MMQNSEVLESYGLSAIKYFQWELSVNFSCIFKIFYARFLPKVNQFILKTGEDSWGYNISTI